MQEHNNILQRGYLKALEQLLIPFLRVINSEWVTEALNELLTSIRAEVHRIDREKVYFGGRR